MAARQRKKKQTLAEFRAWLSGVEELQPEGWAPDATQWVLIREKINNIIEPKSSVDEATIQKLLVGVNQPAVANHYPPQQGNPYQMGGNVNIPPPPPPAVGVPPGQVVEQPAAIPQQSVVLKAPPEIDIAGAAKPNLDTTDGNYNSGFS